MPPFFLIFTISLCLAWLVLPFLLKWLDASGYVKKNYCGAWIPAGAGVLLPFLYLVFSFFYPLFWQIVIAVVLIAAAGWLDDFFGEERIKGFKGHMAALFRGRFTTGMLKLFAGGFVSLFLAGGQPVPWYEQLTSFLFIPLLANVLNLLDVRPGRCIKGFWMFSGLLFVLTGTDAAWLVLAPALAGTLVLFRRDVKGAAMLGDTGSNVLGILTGYGYSLFLPFLWEVAFLTAALWVNLYAERHSITSLIERTSWLRWIDEAGKRA